MQQVKCRRCKEHFDAVYEVCPFCGNIVVKRNGISFKKLMYYSSITASVMILGITIAFYCMGYLTF
ncbi:MAG: hypothetical protein RR234_00510 [Christensenella sp.]